MPLPHHRAPKVKLPPQMQMILRLTMRNSNLPLPLQLMAHHQRKPLGLNEPTSYFQRRVPFIDRQ